MDKMPSSAQTTKPNVVAFPTREPRSNAAEAKQRLFERFFDNALYVIYDDTSMPQIIESLKGDGNPVAGLANTAAAVVVWVADSAEQAGQPLPPDVVFYAGVEILEDLAELAGKAGVHEFTAQEIEIAAFRAMGVYYEMKNRDGGAGRPRIFENFNRVVALDRAWRLDEVAPVRAERFGHGAQGGDRCPAH